MTQILDEHGRRVVGPTWSVRDWFARASTALRSASWKWLAGLAVSVAAVFSTHIAESLKFALNRADLRVESYEQLSEELSEHIFIVELVQEHLENAWTTTDALVPLLTDYNSSITRLRKREFVNRSRVGKYWDTPDLSLFEEAMQQVRIVDGIIHSLNDEFELVNIRKTKEKIDAERATTAAARIAQSNTLIRQSIGQLLAN